MLMRKIFHSLYCDACRIMWYRRPWWNQLKGNVCLNKSNSEYKWKTCTIYKSVFKILGSVVAKHVSETETRAYIYVLQPI